LAFDYQSIEFQVLSSAEEFVGIRNLNKEKEKEKEIQEAQG
jgi:hypothetical protein